MATTTAVAAAHASSPFNNTHHKTVKIASYKFRNIGSSEEGKYSLDSVSSRRRFQLGAAAITDGAAIAEEPVVLPEGLCMELMPKHVAIIMDGHGRWAAERGLPTEYGHRAGADTLERILYAASCHYRIKVFSLYAFSTENWARSKREVNFSNYEYFIRSTVMELITRHDMRFSAIGDKSRLPSSMQSAIHIAEELSQENQGMHFVMALSYSGRLDITEACKRIAAEVENGTLRAADINENALEQHLMTKFEFPNPDLLIRTSGELRMSNFMMWQLAYTEFYFAEKMFPDFDEAEFREALTCFQRRKRRFGGRSN